MFNLNSIKSFIKRIKINKSIFNRNNILIGIAVIAIVATGVLIYFKSNNNFSFPSIFGISDKQVAERVINYINNNKLSNTPASLVSVSQESGLVKVKIKIGTQEFDSYATKDGKLLFPQAFENRPFRNAIRFDSFGIVKIKASFFSARILSSSKVISLVFIMTRSSSFTSFKTTGRNFWTRRSSLKPGDFILKYLGHPDYAQDTALGGEEFPLGNIVFSVADESRRAQAPADSPG